MSFAKLPDELLLMIFDEIEETEDKNRLVRLNKNTHRALNIEMYKPFVKAACFGLPEFVFRRPFCAGTIDRFVEAGADMSFVIPAMYLEYSKPIAYMEPSIIYAATNFNTEMVRFFLSRGVDAITRDGGGWRVLTRLMWGPIENNLGEVYDIAKMLLDAGEDPNCLEWRFSPLHYACKAGDKRLVALMLMYGGHPRFDDDLDHLDAHKHVKSGCKDEAAIRQLLEDHESYCEVCKAVLRQNSEDYGSSWLDEYIDIDVNERYRRFGH